MAAAARPALADISSWRAPCCGGRDALAPSQNIGVTVTIHLVVDMKKLVSVQQVISVHMQSNGPPRYGINRTAWSKRHIAAIGSLHRYCSCYWELADNQESGRRAWSLLEDLSPHRRKWFDGPLRLIPATLEYGIEAFSGWWKPLGLAFPRRKL